MPNDICKACKKPIEYINGTAYVVHVMGEDIHYHCATSIIYNHINKGDGPTLEERIGKVLEPTILEGAVRERIVNHIIAMVRVNDANSKQKE